MLDSISGHKFQKFKDIKKFLEKFIKLKPESFVYDKIHKWKFAEKSRKYIDEWMTCYDIRRIFFFFFAFSNVGYLFTDLSNFYFYRLENIGKVLLYLFLLSPM